MNSNRAGLNVDLNFDLYRSINDLTEIAQKAAADHDFILLKHCFTLAEKLYSQGERLVKDVLENTFIYSFSRPLTICIKLVHHKSAVPVLNSILNSPIKNTVVKKNHISFFAISIMIALIVSCGTKDSSKQPGEQPAAETKKPDSVIAAANPPSGFKHAFATVNGVKIHYVTRGRGEPLILLHGFGQNWYMWNRLLPEFAKHFTVVAPDLRGMGESDKPDSGYDKKTMAVDIHELVKKLGYNNINLAGHDIGLMVAYAYAAQFGPEVKKLALMDALLPGVEPVWSDFSGKAWWFGFFARPVSGYLAQGKEGAFLMDFWPVVGHVNDAFTKEERDEFIRAFSVPGSTTACFHWFGNFPQDALDNHVFEKNKLQMPVLAMGAEYGSGSFLANHSRVVATHVTEVVIKGAGHWIVQEQTDQVQKAMLDFFLDKKIK